ncbi:MAG: hypothetical protein AABW46_01095 [Nanoarchaeota archaeon]
MYKVKIDESMKNIAIKFYGVKPGPDGEIWLTDYRSDEKGNPLIPEIDSQESRLEEEVSSD